MTTRPATSGKKQKLINVHLLDGGQHVVCVDVKSKFQEVYNQITGHLSLRETEYFGLAFRKDNNEYQFVVLDEKIHKHAPKHWKSGPGEGVDSQGKPIVSVWFRVQFYVDQVILLREKVTRHQYYLQLKDNVLQYNHLYSEEKCIQLAAYALQADFGNFVREKHDGGYFNPALYFPRWMLERHGVEYLAQNMPALHKDLHNMTKNDAELRYIKNASALPGALNLHFYMVRRRKTDKICNTWLAIGARGVEVYEDDAGYKNHVSTFMWKDIGKLYFDKKKFEIRSVQSCGGRRYIYYTDCDVKSKYLLSICRSTHIFQMAIQTKLMEIQHLDNEDQKRYRESYVSSEPRERSHFQHSPSLSVSASGTGTNNNNNQRLSVVSDVSSNTTSGIVSDRAAASFDDGDDHTREIIIDCPPRLPRQMRSKLLSGFNYSPHFGSQASPGQNYEVGSVEGKSISAQELTPIAAAAGSGSWRARHSQSPACMLGTASLPTPSPTTRTLDGKPCLVGVSPGHSKLVHGSLLQTGDRNMSGDSAVSVSGIFTGSDKMAAISMLAPSGEQPLNVVTGEGGGGGMAMVSHTYGRGCTVSPALPLNQLTKNIHATSQPPSLNFLTSSTTKASPVKLPSPDSNTELSETYKPIIMSKQYRTLSSPLDVTHKLNSPQTDSPHEFAKAVTPTRNASEHLHFSASTNSPQDMNKLHKSLVAKSDVPISALALNVQSFSNTKNSSKAETVFLPHDEGILHIVQGGGVSALSSGATRSELPLSDVPFNSDTVHHLVTAQVHQSAEPHVLHQVSQSAAAATSATEHYLMALQQGSDFSLEHQKGAKHAAEPTQHSSVVHKQEQANEVQYQPAANEQQQQQAGSWPYATDVEFDVAKEMEENKENLYHRDKRETERKVHIEALQSHAKASLHPELKQILGQTHAFSLPLMTALCNDSTLMQASRSQSGSRSSYDTSTVRSTDSRLTRFSHDTDSRRWSSCCQAANMPEVMMSVQPSRPYSWHSEHFELDSQLVLPATDHLPPTSPPNPRSLNNKHLNMLNNHQNILPQKMIVSDPGPSSPRMLNTGGGGTYWWDAPPTGAQFEGMTSSWADMIPYALPMHHQLSKHESCGGSQQLNHQHMVPHKLSSGGHRDSETSIAHTQIMKENIGIA